MSSQLALHIDHNHQRHTHICQSLKLLGFELHKAPMFPVALEMAKRFRYRLFIIDYDTAGKETYKFCSFIRNSSSKTIIIVLMSSPKIRIEEHLFDCGVNDVIIGIQASARVLSKRIQVRIRNNKPLLLETNTIRLKDTIVDFNRSEVWCNGTVRLLRGISAQLLKYFLSNPNRVISREELIESPIWSDSICSSAKEGGKTFDVNIGKLRRIIESNPKRPQIIISVRGIGWKLSLETFS